MDNLINNKPSMTSLDIAELVGSRPDKVKQSIERLAERGVITLPPMGEKATGGRPTTYYIFEDEGGKRDSIIVVAQLSPEFTARLVDRWRELEDVVARQSLPDFTDEIAAAEAWIEAKKAERLAIGYVRRQAQYIEHLENLFQDGMTPFQFCKQLNGVNIRQVNSFLEESNWLFDDRPEAKSPRWRVKSYARDLYLKERPGQVEQEDGNFRDTFKPILLHKGAIWIYRHYLKGSLPMKKDWNGEYTHDTDLAGAA